MLQLLWPDKLKALRVAHRRPILDRLAVLLVEESHLRGVQTQKMPDLVADICSSFNISAVLKPHLQQTLLLSQTQTSANDGWIFKLLTNQGKEHRLPHFVEIVVVLLNFDDPNSTIRRVLPHGYAAIPKEEEVHVAGHVRRLLQEHIVVEKVFYRGDAPQALQLVTVGRLAVGVRGCCFLVSVLLLLTRSSPIVVPKLPLRLHHVRCGTRR